VNFRILGKSIDSLENHDSLTHPRAVIRVFHRGEFAAGSFISRDYITPVALHGNRSALSV